MAGTDNPVLTNPCGTVRLHLARNGELSLRSWRSKVLWTRPGPSSLPPCVAAGNCANVASELAVKQENATVAALTVSVTVTPSYTLGAVPQTFVSTLWRGLTRANALVLLGDGNTALVDSYGRIVWQSSTTGGNCGGNAAPRYAQRVCRKNAYLRNGMCASLCASAAVFTHSNALFALVFCSATTKFSRGALGSQFECLACSAGLQLSW